MGIYHGGIYGPVSDTAYDATAWDGVTSIAPSKNAVRNKLAKLESAAYIDFTGKPNGDPPSVLDTGQATDFLFGDRKCQIASGRLVARGPFPVSGGYADYYQSDLGAPGTRIGATYLWPSGTPDANGTMAIILWASVWQGGANPVPPSICHLVITPNTGATGNWEYGIFTSANEYVIVKNGTFTNPPADGSTPWYTDVVIDWQAQIVYVYLPDNKAVQITAAEIAAAITAAAKTPTAFSAFGNSVAVVEHYTGANPQTTKYPEIIDVWADTARASGNIRGVAPDVIARLATTIPSAFTSLNTTALGLGASQTSQSNAGQTAVGVNALKSNNTGVNNSGFGASSLFSNTTGNSNSGFGGSSLRSNTTGNSNSGFGLNSLYSNTTGSYNSGFGLNSLYTPGGVSANATTTALRQTAIGTETGQASATQRNDIVAIGYRALVDGNNAIAIGSGTLAGAAGAVAIGKDSAGTSASTTTADEIKLGTALHTTNALGAMKVGKGFAAWGVTPPGTQPAAIASPSAPSAGYVQAEAASAKTAIDAIRAALTGAGITL